MTTADPSRRTRMLLAGLGTLAVIAFAAVAAMQILVWNPEAAVPGATAGQVWAEVGAAGQGPPDGVVVTVLMAGPVLAVIFFVLLVAGGAGPWATVAVYLGLLVGGAPGYFVAAFGPGMGLADTYLIDGADHADGGRILYVVSVGALLGLIAVAIGAAVRGGRRSGEVAAAT